VLQPVWNERRCQHPAAEDGERRVRFVIPVHLSQGAAVIPYEFEPIVGVLLQVGEFHLAQRQGLCNRSTCNRRRQPARSASHHKFLNGGEVGEAVTITLTMADTLKNIKHDTILFKCTAP
jgi:hypothetical protein